MSAIQRDREIDCSWKCGAIQLARSLRVRAEHRSDCRMFLWRQLTDAAHQLGVAAAEFDNAKERYVKWVR
jgi:hypothetical protein